MTEIDHHQDLKEEIREAVQSGFEVHQKIKAITLKAIVSRELDLESIRTVIEKVSHGIYDGMTTHADHTQAVFTQAASALDDALAIATEASKLAIEEAVSRVSEYSKQDLDRAAKDMQGIENLFLDNLEKAVKGSNRVLVDMVGDFVWHARHTGTSVGKQAIAALDMLKQLPNWGRDTVVESTRAAVISVAEIGSGILLGIAESLYIPHLKK
ncbi:MAG: hypothetical protein HOP23_02660 [Methylococcaceae bacterium]|nr:hypothetical protein [Methylococcaceae bacterium]